jgi:lysophospholipase L1-like esterase
MGDSITAGQYLAKGEKAFPALLEGCDVAPRGVNGDTTRLMLERFPADVQELEPDVVVIQAGHNDCNHWHSDRGLPRVSLDAYKANLKEMAERCRAFGAEPLFVTMTPTRRGFQNLIRAYNYGMRVVATANEVRVVEIRQAFDNLNSYLLADGLHLSAEGHRVYARCVQEALVTALVPA